ncbi:transcription antitermination factor NusB [Capnocytophaga sp. ARDL2]|uniref:transcription antitermination factor NusB n=1 Tax=Capnocytophaga sp. ARDL2 TaxID=3238809 RepID=UPI0035564CA0
MQNLYAIKKLNTDAIDVQEKFLVQSMENTKKLYLLMLSALIEIQKKELEYLEVSSQKHLATPEEKNPNKKFVNNAVLQILVNSDSLNNNIEENGIDAFKIHENYITYLRKQIKNSDLYKHYMRNNKNDFSEDQDFIINLYKEIIAPDEKIYEFLEDSKLTWIDDIPIVNTAIVKQLAILKHDKDYFKVAKVFKDDEDKDFGRQLFKKTILNYPELKALYFTKTNNWDIDRVAEMDHILMTMAMCEITKFPSIPVKVTINEYLEIAKEYSTPKSSIFINGILDSTANELREQNAFQKIGRGLME